MLFGFHFSTLMYRAAEREVACNSKSPHIKDLSTPRKGSSAKSSGGVGDSPARAGKTQENSLHDYDERDSIVFPKTTPDIKDARTVVVKIDPLRRTMD